LNSMILIKNFQYDKSIKEKIKTNTV
jgi:hypothetical protein